MEWHGLLTGLFSFVVIGAFHPIVVKCEYYFSHRVWPVFLIAGLLSLGASLLVGGVLASALLGVLGFSCLWSIGELRHQRKRVEKGWFPANPKRSHAPMGREKTREG